jgi:hypothetical protein
MRFKASPGKTVRETLSQKPFTKIGLVAWLKVESPEFKPQFKIVKA